MQWISLLDVALDGHVAFCHQSQINGTLRNFYDNLAKNTALYGEVLLKFRLYVISIFMPYLSERI